MKFTLVTLGCDKNTVDSERYIAELEDRGALFTADADDADVILVNTCGFIDAAKKESIDAIVEAGNRKEGGKCQAVVAVGCMVQRHKEELVDALPEVDLFLGAAEMDRLVPELGKISNSFGSDARAARIAACAWPRGPTRRENSGCGFEPPEKAPTTAAMPRPTWAL